MGDDPVLGDACVFEGDEVPFPELGFTIAVLQPGQSGGRYQREDNQQMNHGVPVCGKEGAVCARPARRA